MESRGGTGRTRGAGPHRHRFRRLRRRADGRLIDLDERRLVDLDELADDVRAGRPFRAQRQGTGAECTNEVLVELLRSMMSGDAGQAAAPALLGMVSGFLRPPADAEPHPPHPPHPSQPSQDGGQRSRRRP